MHPAGFPLISLLQTGNQGIVKENYPTLTGYDINRMMMRAARRAPGNTYPNSLWGYGQHDINKVFQQLTNL